MGQPDRYGVVIGLKLNILEAMAFDDVLGICFLRQEAREGAVLMGGPFKVCTQEPVDSAHEFDLEFGGQEAFKPLLCGGVFGEVNEVINVKTQMEGFVSCSRGRLGR